MYGGQTVSACQSFSRTLRKGAVLTALGTGSVASWSPVPRLAAAAAVREFENTRI